jgi:predicted hydrolase (HD superfamily)
MPKLDRVPAWDLAREWTRGEGLREHVLAVEAALCGYARQCGEDEGDWGVARCCTTSMTNGIPPPPIIHFTVARS